VTFPVPTVWLKSREDLKDAGGTITVSPFLFLCVLNFSSNTLLRCSGRACSGEKSYWILAFSNLKAHNPSIRPNRFLNL